MAIKRVTKKRLVTSFQKLTPELQLLVKEEYPNGYNDAMTRIDKPNGDFFYAVPFETEDIFYLIKVDVKIDGVLTEDDYKDLFDSGSDSTSDIVDNTPEEEEESNMLDNDVSI